MSKEDEVVGTIEDVVRDARLVDKGRNILNKMFYGNAPSFYPERRKFLKHVAVLAGLTASGQLNMGCAISQEPVTYQGKTYSNWEAYLMTQDLIRGPSPLYRPTGGLPYDNHLNRTAFYAIDYDVPIGTPIVPTADTFRTIIEYTRTGGNDLFLVHRHKPRLPLVSVHGHLDKYADIVSKGERRAVEKGKEIRNQELDKSKIIAFSGNTGVGPGGGIQRSHLHFQITEVQGDGQIGQGIPISPGLDPFESGIDALISTGVIPRSLLRRDSRVGWVER